MLLPNAATRNVTPITSHVGLLLVEVTVVALLQKVYLFAQNSYGASC